MIVTGITKDKVEISKLGRALEGLTYQEFEYLIDQGKLGNLTRVKEENKDGSTKSSVARSESGKQLTQFEVKVKEFKAGGASDADSFIKATQDFPELYKKHIDAKGTFKPSNFAGWRESD